MSKLYRVGSECLMSFDNLVGYGDVLVKGGRFGEEYK